jgi:single-stranded-DNA-specific exonuclease
MRWIKDEIDPAMVRTMAKTYGIDTLTASILARRKVTEPGQVLYYLESDPRHLHNPFLFEAMEDAVDRILLAADEGEKVMVFGDSDTDGVTATTLMVEALASAGIEATWRVPRGEEPYGLSIQAVEAFAAEGGTLIVTVDCGISNHAEVDRAAELGVDVIVCDHHKLQSPEPPAAVAVIDPKIEGCGYPFRDLAGAGVAYKLAKALAFSRSGLYKQPVALLHIAKEPAGSTAEAANDEAAAADLAAPARFRIEAARLHNLVETARFSETVEEGSPRTGAILEKLAKFLSGRSIFTFQAASQRAATRAVFGAGVDIQWYDLADEAAIAFPEFAGKTLADIGAELKLARYAAPASASGDLDALKALFSMLAQRKLGSSPDEGDGFLQLATLGTIADLMPLRDENRIIVRRGVEAIGATPRQGLAELLQAQGLGRGLTSTEIAWQVTPLLNAAGRLGKPEIALDLLLSKDPAARMKAVQDIVQANAERKKMGADTWEAVYPLARESYEANEHRFVLVKSPAVRAGITGLLASRMVGVFKVPSIVAAVREDGTIVGSIRTANNFRISGLLAACADLFIDYGGHDAAAGFSLVADRWERFQAIAVEHLKSAELADAEESIAVDAELPHNYLKPELRNVYATFEPFGEENRPLVFMARGVPMVDAQIVGKAAKNHLKLTLDFGKYKWPALLWDGAERLERDFSFRAKDKIDLLFKVTVNRWNGEEKPQLELYDVRRERND